MIFILSIFFHFLFFSLFSSSWNNEREPLRAEIYLLHASFPFSVVQICNFSLIYIYISFFKCFVVFAYFISFYILLRDFIIVLGKSFEINSYLIFTYLLLKTPHKFYTHSVLSHTSTSSQLLAFLLVLEDHS